MLVKYAWRNNLLKYQDCDEENEFIYMENENEKLEKDPSKLKDLYHYTFRDPTEFIFGDSNGNTPDKITLGKKRDAFDHFVAPLVINYRSL